MANNTPDYRASYTDTFSHAFDVKGRITVPSDWRDEPFESRFFIFRSPSPCLRVYPASWFSRLQEKLADAPMADPRRLQLEQLAGSAQNAVVDPQGRIMVKEAFRKSAGLKKETTLVGCTDHFQIWDKAAREGSQPPPITLEGAMEAMGL